ncbi:MAG: PBP1A family penicillin-binding protein [Pseudomonadota bacterium]
MATNGKKPGPSRRIVRRRQDATTRAAPTGSWWSTGLSLLSRRVRLRTLGKIIWTPIAIAASSMMTLAIPLMAINAHIAQSVFPDPSVDLSMAGRPPNILVLAADGSELGSRGSDLGEEVRLDDLPPYVIEAFLATEDRNFYRHPGFDPLALLRATLTNWAAGSVVQGGSTITQQLVKNLFLSGEQTLARKFEELQLAIWLEARLTKSEILELYLNRIYLGANTYGLSAASEAYFSRPATTISLSEAALLAGLPKAPSTLAPHINLDGAIERSHEVIWNLVETRKISRMTAQLAMADKPTLVLREWRRDYGYFLDHVAAELVSRVGRTDEDLIVTTTLEPLAQAAAERAVRDILSTDQARDRRADQAALIAYDQDGGIVAMVGGKSYTESQFNRSTQAKRQPGSAFKPFVYLAALEAGFDQDTVLVDVPLQVDGWAPQNYRGTHLGAHRLREGFARSSNTAAIQLSETIGKDRIIDAARQVGLRAVMEPYPTLPLGVFEVSLDDLTAAYMPFAHEGLAPQPHAISSVVTRDGELLYTSETEEVTQVISPRSAAKMTDLLRAVTNTGTGRSARVEGYDVAGKTGTTDDWRDAWFIGYSAHYTAGVWVGNDENEEMTKVSGATLPAQIWSQFMAETHASLGAEPRFLDDIYSASDPSLSELSDIYTALRHDLRQQAYAHSEMEERSRDGIAGLLRREWFGGRRGPQRRMENSAGQQVTGRLVRPRNDADEDAAGNSEATRER